METGIDYPLVNKRHFRTKSLKRLKMERLIVEGLRTYDDGEIVIAVVTLEMMRSLEATERDMEDIAAFIGQIEGAGVAVTLRELRPGECKLSVRTGGGLDASAVCALLGGGGHAAAAGCTVFGTVEQAAAAILNAIRTVRHG
jgi:phosphoesterase RecJ-like protein